MSHKVKTTVVVNGQTKEVEIEVPDEPTASWGAPGKRGLIGSRQTRVDGRAKVTGKAKYSYDINLPGMLYGRMLRSPYPQAKVGKIDTSKAEKLPGVKAVLTYENRTVRYAGDEVAAVAAVSEEILDDALHLIDVHYEPMPFVVTEADALKEGAPQLSPQGNARNEGQNTQGDVDAALKAAEFTIDATYSAPVQQHVCLETHGVVARWDDDDHVTVWASTQGIHSVREDLPGALNIPQSNITVITEHMGGGFGSKFGAESFGLAACKLAKMAKAPVKMMLNRFEEFLCVGSRPSAIAHIKAAATRDGKITAMDIDSYGTGGMGGGSGFPLPYVYDVPNVRRRHRDVLTNASGARAFRAPGHPQAAYIMEQAVDELAYKVGMDPLEFRRKNDSNETRQKQYTLCAERMGWTRRNATPGTGTGRFKRGIGVGSGEWGGGGGGGTVTHVLIGRDGSVETRLGTQDIGTGTRTVVAVITANDLGLQVPDVKVTIGNTNLGWSEPSGGSTTTPSIAPSVKMAVMHARQQLLTAIAAASGSKVENLDLQDGKVVDKTDPSKTLTWKQACSRLSPAGINAQGQWNDQLQSSGVAGCQMAEVEVDTYTGRVRVLKVVAVHDCGVIINKLTAESQVNGGIIMSMGYALTEGRVMDRQEGRVINPQLEDYKVMGAMEIPEIEAIMYEAPDATKVIGLGEPPTIPTAGAIANAVYNAIGVRVRDLPITPDKVLMALAQKGETA